MSDQLQRSVSTSQGRNRNMFEKIRKITQKPHLKILSFGSSEGHELQDIMDVFDVQQLVGVEYQHGLVEKSKARFQSEPKITIYQSSNFDFAQFSQHFDVIVCCNVLCNFSHGDEPPLPFVRFKNMIEKFWSLLACDGQLFVSGANYLAGDVLDISKFKKHLLNGDSGPVPCFSPDGKKLPRGTAKMWSLQKTTGKAVYKPIDLLEESHPISLKNVIGRSRKVTFGVLCYRSSKNIGDYGQTLAQLNILSRFYRPSWTIESPALRQALEWLSETKPSGDNVRQKNYDTKVTVIWVERDTTQSISNPSHDGKSPVYIIANGWYMHPDKNGEYQWPFAPWVHPFLVSIHIARDVMLQSNEAKDYLRKFGPVGCRDRDTEQLLKNLEIPCFFSGCLTWTLESSCLSSFSHFDRKTRYKNDILREFVQPDDISFSHTMPSMLNETFDDHLFQAMTIYKDYAKAKAIQSTRIHTLMPALSIGAENLWFSSPSSSNDNSWNGRSRFSGLKNFMDQPATRNSHAHAVCERLTEVIDRLLVNGLSGSKLCNVWRGKHYAGLVTYHEDEYDLSASNSKIPFRWSAWRKLHKGSVTDINQGNYDSHMSSNSMLYFHRKEDAIVPTTTYILRNVPIHAFQRL